ncbi:MAG: hypothetical protein A2287_02850 [Candidatus Melainabacteria bacterium RIFOXYA12_FULL_32_12]|nr:MAG: hypothetical protein A2255_08295 [Candidatus Melainabacteria bacterium RIFOXYA2_FULL_32_9]OGI29322.1 MAG: hypothetical protein A2287_02850 [Candidatus Melainabacteria bacterium RIFOXYA12_FULL_32_12]
MVRNRQDIYSASKVIQGYLAPSDDSIKMDAAKRVKLNDELLDNCIYIADNAEEIELSELNTIDTPIVDALQNYLNNPSVPLHIPGHARGEGVLPKFKELVGQRVINLDTTDEFDNLGTLYPADGPIEKAQELAAKAFGASKSFFLINGSSVGNLALALTVTKENKKVIIGRNCHRSVISGITLTGAEPVWVAPERLDDWGIWGPVNPEEIERLLDENPDVGIVWITNPTYEGIVSDTAAISAICKKRNVILIIDEAHGCLWKFNDELPTSALEIGADAVVHSLHKTGGSFSQSSILHLGKNSKINAEEVEANLRMLQSTSPSYMLLASLDAARAYLTSKYGQNRLNKAVENANLIREGLISLPRVKCLSVKDGYNIDPTKIYLTIDGLSGKRLESILEIEYHIEVEAATDNGILALSNVGNTEKELEYFWECIKSIVNSNYSDITYLDKAKYMPFLTPEIVCTPRKAYIAPKEKISPKKAVGKISAEVIAECPPGIPVLVPGERITTEHIPYLTKYETIWVKKDT